MSKKQFITGIFLASLLSAMLAVGGFQLLKEDPTPTPATTTPTQSTVKFSNYLYDTSFTIPSGLNFVHAAKLATPGVVHIKSTYKGGGERGYTSRSPLEDMFKDFFGDQPREYRRSPARSYGSGVIISEDGYIATNNHVIDDADEVEVTLFDNRRFIAKVVGTDPTTDLALIKIDENDLHYIQYGNSDDLQIGEWVLAVGNPFDLTSTVTAGIVSAKARGNLNILRDRNNMQIESFIQTDAAVNPGNSGGALVNLEGKLVGINTAIATQTGSYAGYSFAVPVSLVTKVMSDIEEFGVVQRALLGVQIINVNADLAQDRGFDELNGVYISSVGQGSAAEDAGLEEGDIIVEIDETVVNNIAELQELVARNRPGDKIKVTFKRDGKRKFTEAVLKSVMGDTKVVKRTASFRLEGATFENASEEEMDDLRIDGGAKIVDLGSGKWNEAGIRKGFIVTGIDKTDINNVEDIRRALQNKSGGILVEGVYPDGEEAFYGLGW